MTSRTGRVPELAFALRSTPALHQAAVRRYLFVDAELYRIDQRWIQL